MNKGSFAQSKSARTVVRDTVLLAGLHRLLRLSQFCRGNQLHGLCGANRGQPENITRAVYRHTLVIFSMFRTDFNRISISRRVAMLRAPEGAALATTGCAALVNAWRASIMVWKRV